MFEKVAISNTHEYWFSNDEGLELLVFTPPDKLGRRYVLRSQCKYIANFWPQILGRMEVSNCCVTTYFVRLKINFMIG